MHTSSLGASLPRRPWLAVAADLPGTKEAVALADTLSGLPIWLKVGLELFTAEGPELLRLLAGKGNHLFLDLKFHDIPNTVKSAVRSASRLGASMLTVHLAGGQAMCEAALAGRQEAMAAGNAAPLIVGVTVLTSQGGDESALAERVLQLATLAKSYGLDGVVCSGREVAAVKASCGSQFICVCPGIRFAGSAANDQARVSTPDATIAAGADMLVMGRPIVQAADPRAACEKALALMKRP